MVPYLLGEPHPAGKRLVNVQNCFRAQDIDEVGDNRHTTFFRMLGNWSLGDPARNASQSDAGGKNLLIVLNDRIPDGRDVSWIWDVDFEDVDQCGSVSVAGDRVYDMALRLKYAGMSMKDEQIYTDLEKAISENLSTLNKSETLYILPTYSAMLEVRKILTGKKIL